MCSLVDDSNFHFSQAFLTIASGVSASTASIVWREQSEHHKKKGKTPCAASDHGVCDKAKKTKLIKLGFLGDCIRCLKDHLMPAPVVHPALQVYRLEQRNPRLLGRQSVRALDQSRHRIAKQ